MLCVICDNPIPAARLEAKPTAKTCNKECATENRTRVRRENARRYYHERKAA